MRLVATRRQSHAILRQVLRLDPLEDRLTPTMTTVHTVTGQVGVTVAALAQPGGPGTVGELSVSNIPTGSIVEKAWIYALGYFPNGNPTLTFANNLVVTEVESYTSSGVDNSVTNGWDVTDLVDDNGNYTAFVNTAANQHGVALVVVFSNPKLPFGQVLINAGANVLSQGHQGPTSAFSTFDATAGPVSLYIFTGGDEEQADWPVDSTGNYTDETVALNGQVVGGPIDRNLGRLTSLVHSTGISSKGQNTVTVTSNDDWFDWGLLVVAPYHVPDYVSVKTTVPDHVEISPSGGTSIDFTVERDSDVSDEEVTVGYTAELDGVVIKTGTVTIPAGERSVTLKVVAPPRGDAGDTAERLLEVWLPFEMPDEVLAGHSFRARTTLYAQGSLPIIGVKGNWGDLRVADPTQPLTVAGMLSRVGASVGGPLAVEYQVTVFEGENLEDELTLPRVEATFASGQGQLPFTADVPAAADPGDGTRRAVRVRVVSRVEVLPTYTLDAERTEAWFFVSAPPQPPVVAPNWQTLTYEVYNDYINRLRNNIAGNNAARGDELAQIVAESLAVQAGGLKLNRGPGQNDNIPANVLHGEQFIGYPHGNWRTDPDLPGGGNMPPRPDGNRVAVVPDLVGAIRLQVRTVFDQPTALPSMSWVEVKSGSDVNELKLTRNGSQMIRTLSALGDRWYTATDRGPRTRLSLEQRFIPGTMLYVTLPTQNTDGSVTDKKPDEESVRYAAKKGVIVHHSYLEFAYVNGTDALGGVRFRVKPATNESGRYPNKVNGNETVFLGGDRPLDQAVLHKANFNIIEEARKIDPIPAYPPYQANGGREVRR